MKIKILLLILFLTNVIGVQAQWSTLSAFESEANDFINTSKVAVDGCGNMFVGISPRKSDFIYIGDSTLSSGKYVLMLDANGNYQGALPFMVNVDQIVTDSQGNIYVAGAYDISGLPNNDTVVYYSASGNDTAFYVGAINTGNTKNIHVTKYSPEGEFVWSHHIIGQNNNKLYNLMYDGSDIYLAAKAHDKAYFVSYTPDGIINWENYIAQSWKDSKLIGSFTSSGNRLFATIAGLNNGGNSQSKTVVPNNGASMTGFYYYLVELDKATGAIKANWKGFDAGTVATPLVFPINDDSLFVTGYALGNAVNGTEFWLDSVYNVKQTDKTGHMVFSATAQLTIADTVKFVNMNHIQMNADITGFHEDNYNISFAGSGRDLYLAVNYDGKILYNGMEIGESNRPYRQTYIFTFNENQMANLAASTTDYASYNQNLAVDSKGNVYLSARHFNQPSFDGMKPAITKKGGLVARLYNNPAIDGLEINGDSLACYARSKVYGTGSGLAYTPVWYADHDSVKIDVSDPMNAVVRVDTMGTHNIYMYVVAGSCVSASVGKEISVIDIVDAEILEGDTLVCDITGDYLVVANTTDVSYNWTTSSGITSSTDLGDSLMVTYGASASSELITLYLTNECGTGMADSLEVLVVKVIDATILTGDTLVCEGAAEHIVTANASAGSYNWMVTSGIDTKIERADSLYITYKSDAADELIIIEIENACGTGTKDTLEVIVYADIAADFSWSESAPGVVNFTNLSTGSNLGYTWNFGDGNASIDQNPTHNYISGGAFDVKLKAEVETCSDSITQQVSSTLNQQLFSQADGLKIFPNPASDYILVSLPANTTAINIVDMQGSVVINEKLAVQKATHTIDLTKLRTGAYVLSVVVGTEMYTYKFNKQ